MRVGSPAELAKFLSYYSGQGVDVSLKSNQKNLTKSFHSLKARPTRGVKVVLASVL